MIDKDKKEEIWLIPMKKSPYTNRNVKGQSDNTNNTKKTTQRLRTDLGRSVGVSTATQLVWLIMIIAVSRVLNNIDNRWMVMLDFFCRISAELRGTKREKTFNIENMSPPGIEPPTLAFHACGLDHWVKLTVFEMKA